MTDIAGTRSLLSGNAAIARGAFEAGVTVATGYPGTPSTEILEEVRELGDAIYCEWSPNEKVALEVAAGASYSGARAIVTMKHVGLNVASDPLMTLAYTGTNGGLVVCVADDPGMHSSQNEQDSRHYALFGKIPILEPADSQEAKDFLMMGLSISEEYRTPVLLRSTTRVSHSSSPVTLGERKMSGRTIGFEKKPERYVPIPLWARGMRLSLEDRLSKLASLSNTSSANRIEWGDRSLGIIAEGIAYQYVRELLPQASVLKIGWVYPFPDKLIQEFASGVQRLFIVEELDPILEDHVRSMGLKCEGRAFVPGIGELSPVTLAASFKKAGISVQAGFAGLAPVSGAKDLPARPPVLCPSCPHRGIFYALGKFDVVVTGDIGCYSLGVFAPLKRLDTILCMGAGISMAHGMQKAGEPRKVVGMVGDSTFFHSGMTGLLDIAYNKGTATIIVVDNSTTAMTGHQVHPGTGQTLQGAETVAASIEAIGAACGIKNIAVVNPYDINATIPVLRKALEADEAWLIISRAPCPLYTRKSVGPVRRVNQDLCTQCKACLKLGCPAIEWMDDKVRVNEMLCGGCAMCEKVCPSECFETATGECREQ